METPQPCPHCKRVSSGITFRSADAAAFMLFHSRLMDDVASGLLVVDWGDLPWTDYIDCEVRCPQCGTRFRLTCETYHGSGGEWKIEPRD
jgi:hypothetical protein